MIEQLSIQIGNGGSIPTSPLQFKVIEISAQRASELNALWHSRLPRIHWSNITRNTHYVCYAIIYQNQPFGTAIWSSPVAQNRFKDGKTILELRRMALSSGCPPNTASRFLRIMVNKISFKFPDIKRLISYQDTAIHKGTIYRASGWKIGSKSEFMTWTTNGRRRNPDQSNAQKIRWERTLTPPGGKEEEMGNKMIYWIGALLLAMAMVLLGGNLTEALLGAITMLLIGILWTIPNDKGDPR